MQKPERWEVRHQVPESDPAYQEERELWQNAFSVRTFGKSEIRQYEWKMQTHDRLTQENLSLQAKPVAAKGNEDELATSFDSAIQKNLEAANEAFLEKGELLRGSFERLARDLTLLEQESRGDRKQYVLNEVREMFGVPEIQEELKEHFREDLDEFTALNLHIKVAEGSISDELLYAVAKRHVEKVNEQERQLAELVETTKGEFKEAVKKAVEKGQWPVTAAQALHRIDSVVVSLSDRLMHIHSSILGDSSDSGKITVSNEQLQPDRIERLKKTLFHEFLHELSGKSITLKTRIDEDRHQIRRILHRKSGVSLSSENQWHSPNRWLNEAITEWLALQLSGYAGDATPSAYKGSFSYPEERQELDRLFAGGLEDAVVTNAYFENFSSDQPKERRGPAFARLVRRINEVEGGKSGWARLENKYLMNDIGNQMYRHYVYPAETTTAEKDRLTPGTRVFDIALSVGTSDPTRIAKDFVYMANPIEAGGVSISVEAQLKILQKALSSIKAVYPGKVSYSVAER